MQSFAGRYTYLEFDMTTSDWPAAIPTALDAIVTSMCIHHLPDHRKQASSARSSNTSLQGAGTSTTTGDILRPCITATWERANDRDDPEAATKRLHRTPQEQAHHDNHVRYMIPLDRQLEYLRSAGFQGIDVYFKHLENVIYADTARLRHTASPNNPTRL